MIFYSKVEPSTTVSEVVIPVILTRMYVIAYGQQDKHCQQLVTGGNTKRLQRALALTDVDAQTQNNRPL